MQSGTQEIAAQEKTVTSRPTWFIVRFLALWFLSLFVVLIVTLLSDVNWTRPYLEKRMAAALDREVKLGKITWAFGSNGITVETRRLEIKGLTGEPLLTAGDSEIGVSATALLARKVVITFIQADKADVHLIKTGANTWNFDDLIKPGPEIKLLQLTNSRLGLFDESTEPEKRLAPMQLEKVELKLNFPHQDRKRPFFLSFSMPSQGYSSSFVLDGLGVGELEKWQSNEYSFKAKATRVNPRDLERLFNYVSVPNDVAKVINAGEVAVSAEPNKDDKIEKVSKAPPAVASNSALDNLVALVKPIKGLFDFAIDGDGTFDKGISAVFTTEADNVQIEHPTVGVINAGKTAAALSGSLSKDQLSWQDLSLRLHGLEIKSSGTVSEWQAKEPAIEADINGKVPDIGVIQDILTPKPGTNQTGHGLSNLVVDLKPARLSGKADIAIKIEGTTANTNITTSVKTQNLAIKEMLNRANQQFPILAAVGLSNQAHIETDLKVENADRVEIVNGRLVGPGTNLKASGWIDLKHDKSKLVIEGNRIALRDTAIGITTNEVAYKQLLGSIALPGKNSFSLDGTATANATLTSDGSRYLVDGTLKINDASFALKDNTLKLSHVGGNVNFVQNNHEGRMTLKSFTGQIGDGQFHMDGALTMTRSPLLNFTIHATRFDLKHLGALLKLFQIHIPVLTEHQLYGRVKDVVLKVSGTAFSPKIYMSAVPDDMYYQPPGLVKPLRAKAGVIVYDNDQLILREVAIVTNGKTIVTSLTMDHVSKECNLSRVKTKTDSIELADLHYYLSSTAMPPPLRKAYLGFLHQYKITGMQGRAYGDILCLIGKNGNVTFDGLLGLYRARANVSGFPLTKLEGIFAASGDQLLLQDISGYLRGSKFSLDGYIDKYKSKNPTWRAEVAATLAPRELLELIPHVTDELKASRFKVMSQGPLTLRSKVQGSFDYLKAQYSLIADKKDRMTIEGPFGKIYQPADTPLTLDGLINIDKTKIDIGDTHLLVGDTLVSAEGQIILPEPSNKNGTATGKNERTAERNETATERNETAAGKNETAANNETAAAKNETTAKNESATAPIVKLTLRIPQKSPVKSLVAMVDPPLAKDVKGTISGYMTIDGDLKNPRLLSDITVSDFDAKSFNISGLNGRLRSGGAPEIEGDEAELITESILQVDSVKVRNLPITNLKARVGLLPAPHGKSGPIINIEQGEAKLADGSMKFEARFDPSENGIWAKASFTDISASRVGDELIGSPDEITGKGQATVEIVTKGEDYHQLIRNLKGRGNILVEDGVVSRFSDLQTRLTQYNLLTQGIFGFNFNNLLQSVWPVRSGEFVSLTNTFSFKNGKLKVEELRFSGKDMRIWGSGVANLESNEVKLEMAGKIPRVQASMLGGSFGHASKNITLQKFLKVATFGKLQNLPTLPVLGAIATDKPRTFMFNVDSALDNPKLIARSIEKSFKWLVNKPDATAHPVPGVVNPN